MRLVSPHPRFVFLPPKKGAPLGNWGGDIPPFFFNFLIFNPAGFIFAPRGENPKRVPERSSEINPRGHPGKDSSKKPSQNLDYGDLPAPMSFNPGLEVKKKKQPLGPVYGRSRQSTSLWVFPQPKFIKKSSNSWCLEIETGKNPQFLWGGGALFFVKPRVCGGFPPTFLPPMPEFEWEAPGGKNGGGWNERGKGGVRFRPPGRQFPPEASFPPCWGGGACSALGPGIFP